MLFSGGMPIGQNPATSQQQGGFPNVLSSLFSSNLTNYENVQKYKSVPCTYYDMVLKSLISIQITEESMKEFFNLIHIYIIK